MALAFRFASFAAFSFGLSSLSIAQSPPDGFKSFESKAKGIFLYLPARFEELPVPPGEDVIQLKFTEKETSRNENDFRPEIWIFQITKKSVTTGADANEEKPPAGEDDEEEGEEKKEKLKPGERPKVYSIEDYFAKRVKDWESKPNGSVERDKEKPLSRYLLSRKDGGFKGVAFVHDLGGQTLCLVGLARAEQMADYQKMFEKAAKSLKLKDSGDALANSIESYYKTRAFRGVEYRTKVRMNLPKGWKADDTENYIFIYDTKDEYVIAKIKNDLEAVRTKYVEMFPPVQPIEAVSTVRVCKDKEEFQKFSGMPPNVAGFWSSGTEELVFFDYDFDSENKAGGALGNKNAYIVLYHEAFHQYIYYSCGQLPPHSWFNEGWGDYFSGSVIGRGGKKVDRIGVNPWRVKAIKFYLSKYETAPLKELVNFEQKDYYAKAGIYYAQGWSFIYFLNESKAVKKHPVWSKINEVYFETLKERYKEELEKLSKGDKEPTPEQAAAAQLKARKSAVKTAFKDVDFDELEKAWTEFTLKLKDP